jgi:hypothetical protein
LGPSQLVWAVSFSPFPVERERELGVENPDLGR